MGSMRKLMILSIKAILSIVNFKVKVKYNIKMANLIKATSNRASSMDMVSINILTMLNMKVISKMDISMVKANTLIVIVEYFKVYFRWEREKVKEK